MEHINKRISFAVRKEKYEKQTTNSVKRLIKFVSQTWHVVSTCCLFVVTEASTPFRKSFILEIVLLSCYQNLGVFEEAELVTDCTAETFSLIPAESGGSWQFFLMPKAWRDLA